VQNLAASSCPRIFYSRRVGRTARRRTALSTADTGARVAAKPLCFPAWRRIVAALIVLGAPLYLFYNLILYHFYIQGGLLIDSGLLGSLMWRIATALPTPPWYGEGSFFSPFISRP
jgi:hypothetical protein